MESIFQERPGQIADEETGESQGPSPGRDSQYSIHGWDIVRRMIERECRVWGIKLHGGANKEICGNGQPDGRHYIPCRLGEAFEVCGAKETRRLSEVSRLVDLLQVEVFAGGSQSALWERCK